MDPNAVTDPPPRPRKPAETPKPEPYSMQDSEPERLLRWLFVDVSTESYGADKRPSASAVRNYLLRIDAQRKPGRRKTKRAPIAVAAAADR